MARDCTCEAAGGEDPRRIVRSRTGAIRRWQVGPDRVELTPDGSGWTARVRRLEWGDAVLDVDQHFRGEAEAVVWCGRMAGVLARDREDDRDNETPAP